MDSLFILFDDIPLLDSFPSQKFIEKFFLYGLYEVEEGEISGLVRVAILFCFLEVIRVDGLS